MEEQLTPQLTQADLEARKAKEKAEKLGIDSNSPIPQSLLEALAEEEIILESRADLVKVPEFIFKRDILPAISGKLGEVDMRWWIRRFGSATKGFLVVKDNTTEVLFEFPSMAPSNRAEDNSDLRPVGDVLTDYRNQVSVRPQEASGVLKSNLRDYLKTTDALAYIENIAQVERICRHYGESILQQARPEFVAVIDEAIAGLDDAWGKLGEEKSQETTTEQPTSATPSVTGADDDDGEASAELYD